MNSGMVRKSLAKFFTLALVDQFLPLQDAAEQQADDDQHDGDFDEGEAFLMAFHGMLRLIVLQSSLQNACLQILAGFWQFPSGFDS
jgi:hypothetical protein